MAKEYIYQFLFFVPTLVVFEVVVMAVCVKRPLKMAIAAWARKEIYTINMVFDALPDPIISANIATLENFGNQSNK